jgi:hypothetical protein
LRARAFIDLAAQCLTDNPEHVLSKKQLRGGPG